MPASPMLSISSNFSSYTDDFAKTAARVVEELQAESIDADDNFYSFCERNAQIENGFHEESMNRYKLGSNGVEESTEKKVKCDDMKGENEEIDKSEVEKEAEEFEFPLIMSLSGSSPAMADEIFCNGKIRPTYSFSLNNFQVGRDGLLPSVPPVRQPLRLLFLEDTDSLPSRSSSSETDDLDDLPPESYCLVERKMVAVKEDGNCKKSKWKKSRWKLKNFLNRSSSDGGKGTSIFPTSDKSHHHGRRREDKFERSKLTGHSHGNNYIVGEVTQW